jgi:ankyrin repeat protein/serine/threonine protein kinase
MSWLIGAPKPEANYQLLFEAASTGNLSAVARLVERKGYSALAQDDDGQTLLHWACYSGHLDVAKYLVDRGGVAVDATSNGCWTPLHCACNRGHLDVVQYLVESGADVYAKDSEDGQTPLHCACSRGHLDVVMYLVEMLGGEDVVDATQAADGRTPLHCACNCGHLDVVMYLVEQMGAAADAHSNDGRTALHWACNRGFFDTVKYLLENGNAAVDVLDNDGWTPLHWVCKKANLDTVRYLVERGAAVDAKTNEGMRPLHCACLNGNLDVIKLLVEQGEATLDAPDNDGWTPLHWACNKGQLDSVKYLVEERGAAMDVQDKDGMTPLHRACLNGHLDVVKYMVVQRGAEVNAQDMDEKTPLDLARTWEKHAVVDFLERWQKESFGDNRDAIRAVMKDKMNDPAVLSEGYIESFNEDKEMIGKGAFGIVYKVKDKLLQHTFALKQIIWALPDPEIHFFVERSFKTEIAVSRAPVLCFIMIATTCCHLNSLVPSLQALSRSRHPNIIQLFGFHLDRVGGKHSLLFEYAENGSLAAYLDSNENRAKLTSTRRLHVLLEVIRALHYLHSGAGMENGSPFYHRDLKTANICVTESFTAKLIDCGLGKLVDDSNRSEGSFIKSSGSTVFGTDGYICPWYAKTGKPYEAGCDVYSFGIVMMEMITGVMQKGQSTRNGTDFGDFRCRYLEDDDEEDIDCGDQKLVEDSDPVAGWGSDGSLKELAQLALQCFQEKKKKRPNTGSLIDAISLIIHCDELGIKKGVVLKSSAGHRTASLCMICRRAGHVISCTEGHGLCGGCIDTHVERNLHKPRIYCPAGSCFSRPYHEDALLQFVSLDIYKARKQQLGFQQNLDRICQGVANLTAGTIARCPRLVWLTFPKDVTSKPLCVKDWVCSMGRKTAHIYLMCQHSYTKLDKPIELTVTRDWIIQIAPALRLSLCILRVALMASGLPLPLPVEAASAIESLGLGEQYVRDKLSVHAATFFDELDHIVEKQGMWDALHQQSSAINEITGSAYQLLVEKLHQDKHAWWQDELKPALDKSGQHLIYVKKEYHKLYHPLH